MVLIIILSFYFIPTTHMGVLSEKVAEKFTGDNYTYSAVQSTDNSSYLVLGASTTAFAVYNSNSSVFRDNVFWFKNTTDASNIYSYFAVSLPAIQNNIGNSTFRGFSFSYVIHIYPSIGSNSTYTWGACGVRGHYVFSITVFGIFSNIPLYVNMTSLVKAQINAMEAPQLPI